MVWAHTKLCVMNRIFFLQCGDSECPYSWANIVRWKYLTNGTQCRRHSRKKRWKSHFVLCLSAIDCPAVKLMAESTYTYGRTHRYSATFRVSYALTRTCGFIQKKLFTVHSKSIVEGREQWNSGGNFVFGLSLEIRWVCPWESKLSLYSLSADEISHK